MKYLMLWPRTNTVRHINYHLTRFGEVADYIETVFGEDFTYIDIDALNWDDGKVISTIIKEDIKAIAMYVSTGNITSSINLANLFKEIYPEIKVLAYGNLTFTLPKVFFRGNFDAIHVSGDPEMAIEDFFKYANGELEKEQLSGVNLIENCKFVETNPGKELPIEKWGFARIDKLPMGKYREFKNKNRDRLIINITRGCPFACPHCLVYLTQGRKERHRDLNQLKEYLYTVVDRYNHIKLWAANFTLDKNYVYEFCKMKNECFPNVTFECATRVNLLKDKEILKILADSGCTQISIGIESVNQEELDSIDKGYNAKDLEEVINNINDLGMKVKACIMLGIPGQTKEGLIKTLDYLTAHNVSLRPTIYTEYQNMTDDLSLVEIERYNRRTYNPKREEISFRQYLLLEYDIYNYKEILK